MLNGDSIEGGGGGGGSIRRNMFISSAYIRKLDEVGMNSTSFMETMKMKGPR